MLPGDAESEVRMGEVLTDPVEVGREFVRALSAKDNASLASLLDTQIDFRGLTPSHEWRAENPDEVLEILLGSWFEPTDHIREILDIQTRSVADRNHLLYRLRVENDDGMSLVEQQGYFDAPDGRITRMSLICAGYRPWDSIPPDEASS
jgi:hypothetical protein